MNPEQDLVRLSLPGLEVEIKRCFLPLDPAAELPRVLDPAAALETLHWGRNYLYRARMTTPSGPVDVVVKQFRAGNPLKEKFRGTKAERSFRAALGFEAAGLPTAQPVLLAQSTTRRGPSFFVSRYLEAAVEARQLLRAANAGRAQELFPIVDFDAFLGDLGRLLRRMHDAGFWHRDLSIGNVLFRQTTPGAPLELSIIDLNRSRYGRKLTLSERTRDLCRLSIFQPDHQLRFLAAYWGPETPGLFGKLQLYRLYQRSFLGKIEAKKRVRGGFRSLGEILRARSAHAHIPAAPEGVSARDKVVWDRLSDQPHQHASRFEKALVRLTDLSSHLRTVASVAAAIPGAAHRYRQLARELHREPASFTGLGVGIRPYAQDPGALLQAIDDLGARHVLLRLHPWEENHDDEEALASSLAARGIELTFALPQNRELVKDHVRWRRSVSALAERFVPHGRRFQVGQAINRSKWGVWSYREYADLAEIATDVLRRHPGVEISGPAVIDFEYHATAAVLNMRRPGLDFDAVSALLYVDRRGAPENRQTRLDTVGKVLLLAAVAQTALHSSQRIWLTEFNWPLWEGPHAPAGRDVAVDEETQASYLVRYYLLCLGTGLVERAFWWQVIARGYGLIAPEADGLRRRPAFSALATLQRELAGSTFLGPIATPEPARIHLFSRADGGRVAVAWSSAGPSRVELPWPVGSVVDRDGVELPGPESSTIEIGPAPQYFRLASG